MLCLKCGQREQFAENLCRECLIGTFVGFAVDPVLHGIFCPECNRTRKNRSWVECPGSTSEVAVEVARWNVRIDPSVTNPTVELSCDRSDMNVHLISGTGKGVYKGIYVTSDLRTEVRLAPNVCPYCSRRKGNYYEAILQIRGVDNLDPEQMDSLVQRVRDEVMLASQRDPNIFITNDASVKGGHDFYMGSNSFARQMAVRLHELFSGEYKVSNTLFGRKDGKDLYRTTYLVRLPGFMVGDYLRARDRVLKVLRIHRKVHVRDLSDWKESHIELGDAMSMTRLSPASVESDLVVIMETPTEVQVMHPVTYSITDLVKPAGYTRPEGSTVRCVVIDGAVFLT